MDNIALVHEWLTTYGGSEGVIASLLEIWPEAPVYTLVYDPDGPCDQIIQGHQIIPSFIQKLPFAKKKHQSYLPLMPFAVEQFDLSGYDIVISSSHAVAKGAITGPGQFHLSYIYTPIRYAWDMTHTYLRQSGLNNGAKGLLAKLILHYLRLWDLRTANGVDYFVGISNFVARRIWKVYRRHAAVIYPPVDVSSFSLVEKKDNFYLTVSRAVPYKKVDLVVEAFTRMPERKLFVIGDGSELSKIRERAGVNVELLGYQPKNVVVDLMQRAKAFVFASEEDFGIVPVEAQACGTPVIAYGKGGALETVIDGETGLFFPQQTVESIVGAVDAFESEQIRFDIRKLRKNAEKFSEERFKREFLDLVDREWNRFKTNEIEHRAEFAVEKLSTR